jgi:hypothetical protein
MLTFISTKGNGKYELQRPCVQIIGCGVFGVLADKYGRLPAFLLGTASVSICGVASALAQNLPQAGGLPSPAAFESLFIELSKCCWRHLEGVEVVACYPLGERVCTSPDWHMLASIRHATYVELQRGE